MRTYIVAFRSGDKVEIDKEEYGRLMNRFNMSGHHFARYTRPDGEIFMLVNIERIIPQGEEDPVEIEEPTEEAPKEDTSEKSSVDEERQKVLDDMIARSSCKHEVDQILYKQDTKTGPRFFTICSFCGGNRSRYIAISNLDDEEMKNAPTWVEKES
jgi:hypothetical protein